jgi:apolipoprotein N-acyltransferase
VALAALSGVMHGACFPRPGLWPLAFVALGPLVAAVRGRSAAAGFALGWVEGTIASAIAVVPWIAAAAREYFEMGPARAWLFGALTGQIFGAITFAMFAAAASRLGRMRSPSARVAAMAAAWTALELLRARAFTGAPWDLLAHALYERPLWIRSADPAGRSSSPSCSRRLRGRGRGARRSRAGSGSPRWRRRRSSSR